MSELIHRTKREAKELAREQGLICFIARSNELLLDFDGDPEFGKKMDAEEAQAAMIIQLLQQNKIGVYVSTLETKSKSGGGTHCYIQLGEALEPMMRIAIQACMGSDSVRELLSAIRVHRGVEAPTCLFETPKEAKRVRAWREKNKARKMQVEEDDDVPF